MFTRYRSPSRRTAFSMCSRSGPNRSSAPIHPLQRPLLIRGVRIGGLALPDRAQPCLHQNVSLSIHTAGLLPGEDQCGGRRRGLE
jgi:hypothetical protein